MAKFDLSTVSDLFKIKYGPLSMNAYNSANVLLGRVKKEYKFGGKRMDIAVPLSFSGGVGSGSLPTSNYASYSDAQLTRKKVYSTIQIDREAMKASMTSEAAFVELSKEAVKKGVESFNRNMSRILFGNSDGSLGQFSGNAAGTATSPILTITSASFKAANWEERDYVNVNSLSSVWEVVSVDESTRAITLSRISGSDDLTAIGAGTHTVYMQNSKNNDPSGLKGVLDATSGSLYGITVARRWQAYQKNAASAGISADILNEGMLEIERRCGQVPNLIITSFKQYRKILNFLEDQKRYTLDPRAENLKGKISFKGVEFMSSAGPVGIFPERFCEDDRVYLLNDNYITLHHAPESPGWADDDGTVLLRDASSDSYSARYASYVEAYIPPTFHGVISSLAV